MLRWHTVLPTSPQGTKANELGAEVLLAYQSRIWQVPGMVTHGRGVASFGIST